MKSEAVPLALLRRLHPETSPQSFASTSSATCVMWSLRLTESWKQDFSLPHAPAVIPRRTSGDHGGTSRGEALVTETNTPCCGLPLALCSALLAGVLQAEAKMDGEEKQHPAAQGGQTVRMHQTNNGRASRNQFSLPGLKLTFGEKRHWVVIGEGGSIDCPSGEYHWPIMGEESTPPAARCSGERADSMGNPGKPMPGLSEAMAEEGVRSSFFGVTKESDASPATDDVASSLRAGECWMAGFTSSLALTMALGVARTNEGSRCPGDRDGEWVLSLPELPDGEQTRGNAGGTVTTAFLAEALAGTTAEFPPGKEPNSALAVAEAVPPCRARLAGAWPASPLLLRCLRSRAAAEGGLTSMGSGSCGGGGLESSESCTGETFRTRNRQNGQMSEVQDSIPAHLVFSWRREPNLDLKVPRPALLSCAPWDDLGDPRPLAAVDVC